MEHGAWSMEHGARSMEHGERKAENYIRDPKRRSAVPGKIT